MSESFLSRRTRFGISGALLVLLVFFFLLPSAFRGARLAVANKKNDIKDWLPGDFLETAELQWFAKYFVGESFVVATWDGCNERDHRLSLLASKLRRESAERDLSAALPDVQKARQLAEELKLFVEPSSMDNWGGANEKWFATPQGQFYYITPDGRFYRWQNESNAPQGILRAVQRSLGSYQLQGQFIAAFGEPSRPEKLNAYYNDPTLLSASLFQSVQTGVNLAEELSREGGPLWPVGLTDETKRAEVAKDLAIERLTGTLFAPAVPDDFAWTPQAVFDHLPKDYQAAVPADFDYRVRTAVQQIVARLPEGTPSLQAATTEQRNAAWAEVCQSLDIGVPPRQTCVLVTLTPFGKEHLARSIGRGVLGAPRGRLLILADQSGVAAAPPPSMAPPPFDHPENQNSDPSGRSMLRMGGPPVDNVAIDEEGTVTLIRLVGYSGLVGIGLAFLCFRSVKLTIMIFMVGLASALLGLAITYWAGGHVDAILMTMPSMVYISGLSGAIHIVNYCQDETRQRGAEGAIMRAVKHAFGPAFLCSFTTSLGLFALCSSNLVPIRNFGLYTGLAVMAMLIVLFTYMPAALEVFPPKFLMFGDKSKRKSGESGNENPLQPLSENSWVSDVWAAVGRWITAHHALVSVVCIFVLCVSIAGLFRIKTTVQLLKLFDSESRIISDYAYLEKNFGKLVPMEVVVRVPPEMQSEFSEGEETNTLAAVTSPTDQPATGTYPLSVLERVEAVGRVDTVARRALGDGGIGVIGKTMSAVTFLPPLPEPSSGYTPVRARFQNELKTSLPRLADTDCYRVEADGPRKGSELWRISLRVGALSDVDYGQFVGDLRLAVTPVLEAYRARGMILNALGERAAREAPRVLIIGHREPKPLASESLLDKQKLVDNESSVAERISSVDTQAIYCATIGELLANERVKRPLWLDVTAPDTKVRPGNARWDQLLQAVDCVVLVGAQPGVDAAAIASKAKRFVDVRLSQMPVAAPGLEGLIPRDANAGPLEAIYTGIVPVVYKAQRTLLASLVESTIMASVSIAAVMAFLMIPGRLPLALFQPVPLYYGVMAGIVAMVPNMFPIMMVFGIMGHANFLVDIGTMMTASVALGIAVDDTIHFLSWFRQYLDEGMNRVDAIVETYKRVGPAMMQTAFVGGLGMFVFSLSTFTPTQRFGTLMLVLLMTALLGDLVLLPALLAGPLGRWFRPRHPKTLPELPSMVDATATTVVPADNTVNHAARTAHPAHSGQAQPSAPKGLEAKAQHRSSDRTVH